MSLGKAAETQPYFFGTFTKKVNGMKLIITPKNEDGLTRPPQVLRDARESVWLMMEPE